MAIFYEKLENGLFILFFYQIIFLFELSIFHCILVSINYHRALPFKQTQGKIKTHIFREVPYECEYG